MTIGENMTRLPTIRAELVFETIPKQLDELRYLQSHVPRDSLEWQSYEYDIQLLLNDQDNYRQQQQRQEMGR